MHVCSVEPSLKRMSTLRLLSYNFWLRPPGISDREGDWKDERIQQFLEHHIHEYDVLCFQEFFGSFSARRSRFIQAARERGYAYSYFSVGNGGACLLGGGGGIKLVDGGLLIISKYRLSECDQYMYRSSKGVDGLAEKGVLYVRVDLPSGAGLHLFVTHLQASYQGIDGWDIQQLQLMELREFIDRKLEGASLPLTLLLGDFNVNSVGDDRQYKHMCRLLSEPVDLMLLSQGQHPITYTGCSPAQCIDYIFEIRRRDDSCLKYRLKRCEVHNMAAVLPAPFPFLSDHFGVAVTLEVDPPKIDLSVI